MISRTSLFNRGIYKATVKRYIWGAVFYAIVLFMVTAMPILFGINPETYIRTMDTHGALILSEEYLYIPLIISFAVPTVVALLVYRFVHSKKTSIFVHSLPVSRSANYISTLFASLTLMAAPIVLNGLILMAVSLFGYGAFFDIQSCLIWIGMNLLSVFLMFSISSLAAFLTGNSFAMVGINILLHCIAIIVLGSFASLSYVFLYGYYETNLLISAATKWNFVAYIMGQANLLSNMHSTQIPFDWGKLVIIFIIGLLSYIGAFLLYKKRRIETAEDVAAYKCLNPIYKYLLTFLGALGAFGIFSYTLEDGSALVAFVILIVSAVVYFAAEMLLKKSLKIWKSYKGYLVFLGAFVILVCVFAFTSFFGYETRVPQVGNIESVAVHESRALGDEHNVSNPDIIDYALSVHKELVEEENVYTLMTYPTDRDEYLYFNYKLKNGGTVIRRYPVTEDMLCRVLDNLYKSHEYKRKALEIFSDEMVKFYDVQFGNVSFSDEEKVAELVECLRTDILELDYTQIRNSGAWSMNIHIGYTAQQDEKEDGRSRAVNYTYQRINANFTRTVTWLIEHGYLDKIFNEGNYDLTVLTAEQWQIYNEEEKYTATAASYGKVEVASRAYPTPTIENIAGAVRISDAETKAKIRDYVVREPVRYVPGKEYSHYVCVITEGGYVNAIAAFYDGTGLAEIIG